MLGEFKEYSDRDHAYYADGRERISVTQVLDKCGLISQFCRDEEAAKRGNMVHKLTAADDQQRLDFRKVPVVYRGYLTAWRQFRKDVKFVPELIEHRIDDSTYGYAGRLDRFGNGIVLDIKTSIQGTVADYVRYQLVAYAHALHANQVLKRLAVALRPNGRYNCKAFPVHEFIADRAQWFSYLKQAKEQKENGRNAVN
jgi:hypothetical protein